MTIGGECESVQTPLIKYAQEVGWEYVSPNDALRFRCGEKGLVFKEIFINQMQKLNQPFMDNLLAEELIKKLEHIPADIEGNLIAWEYLKGLRTVFVPNEKRERNTRFIDADHIEKNIFQVTDEFSFSNGTKTIRPDVVFLINGLPIFFVETKSAKKTDGIAEALDQVRRYHRETPEIMAVLQFYALTHLIHFYYSVTWNSSRKWLFNWKEETKGNFETLVKTFLDKEKVVKLLTEFILFTRQDDELKKIILRPHQIRAVESIMERASSDKKHGLIWHTQGSGKTYTMIVAAQKLIENPLFGNPTIIMLVDRNELESQLFGNLAAVGIENVEVAHSKNHLQELLKRDKRGLIVSMIHKFEGTPEKINSRDNIFVLVDEAHRTTGGKLGNYLMGAIPNATYIGFTGTPIDRTAYGKGTFKTFGLDDPPHGYLDKYSISESIEDGTTVPLHYTLAPNEIRVDKGTLEKEFLDLKEAEGISDVEELNKVLEKAVTLRNMLKNSERTAKVAKYIADHFRDYVEPMGYKAFVVGVDREACAIYKEELDKHLPPEYSKVVYSSGFNDPPELAKYHISEDEEKKIRKAFRKPNELPKILIVTEKLLTGFDAPILYCMYLDKPMRDHVLLQAIARVNRPHEDDEGRKKPSGFVLDFVGIFDNLEKALAFDSTDINGIVENIAVLEQEFSKLMDQAGKDYLVLVKGKADDKQVEDLLQHFMDEEARHQFYSFFREVSDIYEILSPSAFLRPYIRDYETLAGIYRILKEAFEPGVSPDKEFARKTAKLVQEQTKSGHIIKGLEIYQINEDTLKVLQESKVSDTKKIFNLLKSIQKEVNDRATISPYLINIGDRAQLIAEKYRQRQIDTQSALEEIKKLIDEVNAARREQADKEMSPVAFSIFWMLKREKIEQPEERANEIKVIIDKYPHWKTSEKYERLVKMDILKILLKSGIKKEAVTSVAQTLMQILVEISR